MTPDLEPCPFCRSACAAPRYVPWVLCARCGATGPHAESISAAIDAWNRCAPAAPAPAADHPDVALVFEGACRLVCNTNGDQLSFKEAVHDARNLLAEARRQLSEVKP